MLEDGVAVRAGLRCLEHRGHELLLAQAQLGRGAAQLVRGQARGELVEQRVVPAQVGGEQGADAGQLAVVGDAREELVDRVDELVAGAAARPGGAGSR